MSNGPASTDALLYNEADKATPVSNASAPRGLTLTRLAGLFLSHADLYYRRRDGSPSRESANLRSSLQDLCRSVPSGTPADALNIAMIHAWRDRMIARGLTRGYINKAVSHLKRMFAWAVEEKLIGDRAAATIAIVRPLQLFRGNAKEAPIRDVPSLNDCARVVEHIPADQADVRDIVRLMLLTGARVSEITTLRKTDIITEGGEVRLVPIQHKSAHHNKVRIIPLNREAAAIIVRRLSNAQGPFIFPSHRRSARPISVNWVQVSTRRAAKKAGIPLTPHTFRHAVARAVRARVGLDAAQALLGHSSVRTTEIYCPTPNTLASAGAAAIVHALSA